MESWAWIAILVAVVAVVVIIGAVVVSMQSRRRQTKQLQEGFGPEYDRAVGEYGSASDAEAELLSRKERVSKLNVRDLTGEQRNRFRTSWKDTQARFVDDPSGAIGDADGLIQDVMRARGFPVGDFEQRAADISVDHPYVVEHYRAAHKTAVSNEDGRANTEDMRQAMVHYRELFTELVNAGGSVPEVRGKRAGGDAGSADSGDNAAAPRDRRDDRETHREAGRLGKVQRRR